MKVKSMAVLISPVHFFLALSTPLPGLAADRIYLVDPSRTIVIGDFGVDYSGATCAESISFSFPPSSNEETFVLVAGQPSCEEKSES